MFFYDPTVIFLVIGAFIASLASSSMNSTFSKFSRIPSSKGMTGVDVANLILNVNGLNNINVNYVPGKLTDHYNPLNETISLSNLVYNSTSIAAVSVAAHECGHAIQKKENYLPYNIRTAIVPVVNFGQNLAMPIFLIGLLFGSTEVLMPLGIYLFSFGLIFQLVTLPVEFDASRRGLYELEANGILKREEIPGSRKVLKAAALTYVAGVVASLLSILRLVVLTNMRRDD